MQPVGKSSAFCSRSAQVQGMKFAALTLKESQDNGGDYYILFSNRPPSEQALPSSDCSAGAALKYGIKPKSKVRTQGQFVTTWKSSGTTWKAAESHEPFAVAESVPRDCTAAGVPGSGSLGAIRQCKHQVHGRDASDHNRGCRPVRPFAAETVVEEPVTIVLRKT